MLLHSINKKKGLESLKRTNIFNQTSPSDLQQTQSVLHHASDSPNIMLQEACLRLHPRVPPWVVRMKRCEEFLRFVFVTSCVNFRRGRLFVREPKCKIHIQDFLSNFRFGFDSPARRISPSFLFLYLPSRVCGGILQPQTNAFLPWMTLLSGNHHSLEICGESIFPLKIGREGFVRFKNLQINMVEPTLSKRHAHQSEIVRQL